jgi:hypothetical protein
MILNSASEARILGQEVAAHIHSGKIQYASAVLGAYLDHKNAFRLLDLVGGALDECPTAHLDPFLEAVARGQTMGGWIVIASALRVHPTYTFEGKLSKCRAFIIQADAWYACDSFGERVPGPLLITNFQESLKVLSAWRVDQNAWVRRAVGVAVHFWAKRTKGAQAHLYHATALLDFLKPMLLEKGFHAAKGVGWGLKTLGRYYPAAAYQWLCQVLLVEKVNPMGVIKRKALTYLPAEMQRALSRRS